MNEEDLTLPVPKPFLPDTSEITASQIRQIMEAGMGMLDSSYTQSLHGWQPPSVEDLQKALPQYEITEFLSRGGMGAVYKGRQTALRRNVAIKILPADLDKAGGDRLQFAERFKHEAQSLAQLTHPGIVAVYDAGETAGGLLYFVMEFVEGTDVQHLIHSQGRLPADQALEITTRVCEALAFAHAEGIIHRDIKPSNIMLDQRGRVKVADFGLAKALHMESTLLTASNLTMGTPDFVAPEVFIPGIKADQRADIYAVGVMLYQMLTGSIPRGRFHLPSFVVPQIDPRLDAVVDRAMQTDRERRYSTAVEMRADLDRIVAHTADASAIASVNKPLPTAGKMKPALIGALAVTAVALTAGGGWILSKKRTEKIDNESKSVTSISSPKPPAPASSLIQIKADGTWHDLLSKIDPKRDTINGRWSQVNGKLVCTASPWAMCEIPIDYHGGNYDLRVSVTRGEGQHLAMFFPFRKGEAGGDVVFDYYQSGFADGLKRAGLENLIGRRLGEAGSVVRTQSEWIPRGKKSTVLLQVRDDGVAARLNDVEVFRWVGDWTQLRQANGFERSLFTSLEGRPIFGVGLFSCDATYHSIEIRPLPPQESQVLAP